MYITTSSIPSQLVLPLPGNMRDTEGRPPSVFNTEVVNTLTNGAIALPLKSVTRDVTATPTTLWEGSVAVNVTWRPSADRKIEGEIMLPFAYSAIFALVMVAGAIGSLKFSTTLVTGLTSIALASGDIANSVGALSSTRGDVVKRYEPLERELPARSTAVVLMLYCVPPNRSIDGVKVTVLPDTS